MEEKDRNRQKEERRLWQCEVEEKTDIVELLKTSGETLRAFLNSVE